MIPQDIRICFVGDSLVNGTGDETSLGWAGRLCAAASANGHAITYYNLGIRRDTTRDILLRWEHECDLRLPPSCDCRIVVSCGINDTVIEDGQLRVAPEASCINLQKILARAKRYKLIMVGPTPVEEAAQNARIETLSKAYAKTCQTLDVAFIGLVTDLLLDDFYLNEVSTNDGSHPNSGGYAKIARLIERSPDWWF